MSRLAFSKFDAMAKSKPVRKKSKRPANSAKLNSENADLQAAMANSKVEPDAVSENAGEGLKPDSLDDSKAEKPSTVMGINWKRVDWIVRTGLVLIMAYIAITILASIFFPRQYKEEGLSSPEQVQLEIDETLAQTPVFLMEDFINGNWTLGESKWQFQSSDLKATPSEEVFARPPEKLRGYDKEFGDKTFVELFKAYGGKKKKVGDLFYYRASYFGANGSMFTSPSPEGEIVQVLRVAFPTDNGSMTYIETAPSEYAVIDAAPAELLPLCEGAVHVAVRKGENGVVSSAIVNFDGSPGVILSHWSGKGWKVTLASQPGTASKRYRCEKTVDQENVTVIATFMEGDSAHTIMLVRVPDSNQ